MTWQSPNWIGYRLERARQFHLHGRKTFSWVQKMALADFDVFDLCLDTVRAPVVDCSYLNKLDNLRRKIMLRPWGVYSADYRTLRV